MSAAVANPPAAPAQPTTVRGDVAIPEISSSPGGAQGVKPAPTGTIPQQIKPFSEREGSAKSKALERLRAKATPQGQKPNQPPKPADANKPAQAAPAAEPEVAEPEVAEGEHDEENLLDDPKPVEGQPAEGEKKRPNPWHLLKEQKAERAKLEKEISDLRKVVPTPEARKSEVAEIERLRQQNREYLDKIRFKDYESHPEFKEKYDEPYKKTWKGSMRNLEGVMVESEDGQRVEISADHMLSLVNAKNKVEARRLADEWFGEMANDVMTERDKIRDAYEARETALQKAKTEGLNEHEAKVKQEHEAALALGQELKGIYERANEFHSKDPKMKEFFQPIDGDEDANSLLERGYKIVDEAFAKSPMDPSLTPKERESLIKKHAAVRHRAAAFGRVRHLLQKERAAHADAKRKLAEYEGTVPNRGESKPNGQPMQSGSKMSGMLQRLRARAK